MINPNLFPAGKLPYDTVNDFAPITGLVRINQALIARNSLPAADVAGLIKLAKQRPGELTYGTAGVGSAPQMNLVKFENMAGVSLRPVHYRGAAPALNDIMAGHIDVMSVSVSLVVQPHQERKLKILAVGSRQRVPQLPDHPTVSESGLSNYEAATWFGLVGPESPAFRGHHEDQCRGAQNLERSCIPGKVFERTNVRINGEQPRAILDSSIRDGRVGQSYSEQQLTIQSEHSLTGMARIDLPLA